MDVILEIDSWIDNVLVLYSEQTQSCLQLESALRGAYPKPFLEQCQYVIVEEIPRPNLSDPKYHDFLTMPIEGITYKNVYFIKAGSENDFGLHLHELVHAVQWKHLGSLEFITRYLRELEDQGYYDMPLENMAYYAQDQFNKNVPMTNLPHWVINQL